MQLIMLLHSIQSFPVEKMLKWPVNSILSCGVFCSLKTNWLKWNPDYDNASHSFDKAGKEASFICTAVLFVLKHARCEIMNLIVHCMRQVRVSYRLEEKI